MNIYGSRLPHQAGQMRATYNKQQAAQRHLLWAKLQPTFVKTYHQKQNPNAVLLAQQTPSHRHLSEVYDIYVLVKASSQLQLIDIQ